MAPGAKNSKYFQVGSNRWVLPLRPIPWIALGPTLLSLLIGCGGAPDAAEAIGATEQPIYSGTIDNDDDASAGVVSVKIGNGSSFELCSGSLLAPNVVLTARHCISTPINTTVSCNERGDSGNGDHVGADEPLDRIHVYTGSRPSFGSKPTAGVRSIVRPEGGVLCNADIALLVLDAPITNVAPMKVRLSSTPHPGETIRAVGYGQNDHSVPVGTRLRKDAVAVLAVGQRVSSSQTPLGSHEFEVGLSICQGDSGGPAISEETGAVIGVVSRGGECEANFGHIYTATNGFPGLFARAFQLAGAQPLDEGTDPHATDPTPATDSEPLAQQTLRGSGCAMGASGADEPNTLAWLAALIGPCSLMRRRRQA